MRLLSILLLLAGCPKPAPSPLASGPLRLTVTAVPFQDMCISPVAAAGPLKAKDAEHVNRAITFLSEGRFNYALTALAQTSNPHPAVEALRASTMVLMGKVDEAALIHAALIADWPQDSCLLMAAALNSATQGKLDEGAARARAAWDLDPTDADAALLWASFTGTEDPTVAAKALDEVYAAFPDHPGAAWLAGIARLDQGDNEGSMAAFEVARQGGLPVDEFLMELHFAMGDVGAYVKSAAAIPSLPMMDREAIRSADDPRIAFLASLGMGEHDHLWAVLDTSMGELHCQLFPEIAPVTVSNFVGLATGELPWTQPESGAPGEGPLYDGVVFHRVIPEFMVQVGDPLGNGTGGPGYRFRDEVRPEIVFSEPGLLAMANAGPGTNGSQFFITEVPTPHLSGKHTIFGACDAEALELVKEMARVPAKQSRPEVPIVLNTIRIEAVPPHATEGTPEEAPAEEVPVEAPVPG